MRTATVLYWEVKGLTDLRLMLFKNGRAVRQHVVRNGLRTERLATGIMRFLASDIHVLDGIAFRRGAKGFSHERLQAVAANTLGYALGKPVASLAATSGAVSAQALDSLAWNKQVTPTYSAPPVN